MKFSVLMSVYYKEKGEYFKQSIESVLNNSLMPDQIVIVKDGQLTPELNQIIDYYDSSFLHLFTVIQLDENVGLGKALNIGLEYVKHSIVARMDTDDICYEHRFRTQINFLIDNPDISVLGTAVQEFNINIGDLNQSRILPETTEELKKFSKFRNPLNHPTVMFKKKDIISSGSYQDMPLFEDYYLWVRVLSKKFNIANISEPLLHFRIGNDMIGRRSGWSYLNKEIVFLRKIKKIGFLSNKDYIISILIKLPLRLLPKSLLTFFYKKLLR